MTVDSMEQMTTSTTVRWYALALTGVSLVGAGVMNGREYEYMESAWLLYGHKLCNLQYNMLVRSKMQLVKSHIDRESQFQRYKTERLFF
jgi:hypothetical protein